jgi:hypothetical protein
MSSTIDKKALLAAFQREMDSDSVALFFGAGMSRPSGFVDWKALMQEVAEDLGLDINRETDLIALAQFHKNRRKTRHRINQLLVTEFTKGATLSENHRLIASLPISTVWTTNYDHLIEDAYAEAHKRPDVKKRPEDLAVSKPRSDVVVYKMHGDIDAPDEAVLTKEDYATFESTRALFSIQLRGHLVSKSFLFLGYSFSDPNLDYILARIRAQLGDKKREHFCVMKNVAKEGDMTEADVDYQRKKLTLRIEDLQNYGIQTLLIDDYAEITSLLHELNRRAVRKSVFISGSAHDPAPLGLEGLEKLARDLAKELIKQDYNVVSGLGLGIGQAVTMGALEELYRAPASHLDDRLTLRPFPQVDPSKGTRAEVWERYRQEMISRAGFAVFLAGNKLDPDTGKTVEAAGVLREFEIAVSQGAFPIPVGGSGHASKNIADTVAGNLDRYFGAHAPAVKKHFAVLGALSELEKWVDAILAIMKIVSPK